MANTYKINEGTQTTIASREITNHYQEVMVLPDRHPQAFGSVATTASGTAGADIHGAVSGSSLYVTDLVISVGTTAMQVSLHPGGTANTAVFGPYTFAANGGMVSNFRTPRQITSGSALVYTTNADGTVTVEVEASAGAATLHESYYFTIQDLTPPTIESILWITPRRARVKFSESVDTTTARYIQYIDEGLSVTDTDKLTVLGLTLDTTWVGDYLSFTGSILGNGLIFAIGLISCICLISDIGFAGVRGG